MRAKLAARTTHKWLALVFGAQLLVWAATGMYMVAVHIDTIHGDHLVREQGKPSIDGSRLADPLALANDNGKDGVRLAFLSGRAAYVVGGAKAVDAMTGRPIAPPSEAEIRAIASTIYTARDPISSARLIHAIPTEIRGREAPLWRVEFDHWNRPTFYLSPVSGELVTRRHELWRIFDFAWMLHIMDYETRDNVNNGVLILFSLGAVLAALSGGWMLLYAFPRKRRT